MEERTALTNNNGNGYGSAAEQNDNEPEESDHGNSMVSDSIENGNNGNGHDSNNRQTNASYQIVNKAYSSQIEIANDQIKDDAQYIVGMAQPSPKNGKNDPLLIKSDTNGNDIHQKNINHILTQKDLSMMSNINAYVYPTKVYREVIIVTIAVFMGYASLVVVQKKLYNQFKSNNGGDLSSESKSLFEHGTSLVYVGNLLFRLLHNLIFGSFLPRHRVCISLLAVFSSMFLLSMIYFWFKATSVVWVYICYIMGGIGVGTFEANLLATITPLGPDTKVWALVGMPAGFTIISVFGYALMGLFDVSVVFLYLFDAIVCLIGIAIWYMRIPINATNDNDNTNDSNNDMATTTDGNNDNNVGNEIILNNEDNNKNTQTLSDFWNYLKAWREWLPKIKINCFALCVDMFCVSFFSAINQYILTGDEIPLFGGSSVLMNTDDFFSVYSCLSFLGDASGRKLIYYFKFNGNPAWFLLLSIGGAFLCLLKIPFLTWIGYFCIFFANGLVYAATTRRIDGHILKQFALTSLSIWLFVGDVGSVTGSNVWQVVDSIVCPKSAQSEYFCND